MRQNYLSVQLIHIFVETGIVPSNSFVRRICPRFDPGLNLYGVSTRITTIDGLGEPIKPKAKDRAPIKKHRLEIIDRDGYNCRFCGIPVIPPEIRKAITAAYPDSAYWGRKNLDQHAALQCLWLQFDHILPHCWGGESTPDNVVITCAPCNFGRMNKRLEEVGLIDPRERPVYKTSWDGLVRFSA